MLLRYEEAAVRLGVSLIHLRKLIDNGFINKTRVGAKAVRVDEDELKRYIEVGGKAVEKS